MISKKDTPFIPCIQALRFLAAMGVMLSHVGFGDRYFRQIGFSAGVNLFFCISAFLMMYTTCKRKPENFVIKRLIRLVPLYWLLTIATFFAAKMIAGFGQADVTIEELFKSLFFIPYLRDGLKRSGVIRPIVGPAWTLRFDVWFLFVFALAMKISHKWRGIISCGICIGFMVVAPYLPIDIAVKSMLEHGFWLNYVCGIAAFYIWMFMRDKVDGKEKQKMGWALLALTGFIVLFAAGKPLYISSVASLVVLISVLAIFNVKSMPGWISRFGEMSYSFYLTHYYVILILGIFINFDEFSVMTCIGTIVALGLSLITARISYELIEKRFGNFLRKLLLNKG